jgi:hypothetical protein
MRDEAVVHPDGTGLRTAAADSAAVRQLGQACDGGIVQVDVTAGEFREHATGKKRASQIFVTTHHPYFVDALDPVEVWILEKGKDGFATIKRASDDEIVKNTVQEGLPLGGLWYSDYLDAR